MASVLNPLQFFLMMGSYLDKLKTQVKNIFNIDLTYPTSELGLT